VVIVQLAGLIRLHDRRPNITPLGPGHSVTAGGQPDLFVGQERCDTRKVLGDSHDCRDFASDQRPDVEVFVDAVWYRGELRVWLRPRHGGEWWGIVNYRTEATRTRVATVHQDRIRLVQPPVKNELRPASA
jgi:hypothetical protein